MLKRDWNLWSMKSSGEWIQQCQIVEENTTNSGTTISFLNTHITMYCCKQLIVKGNECRIFDKCFTKCCHMTKDIIKANQKIFFLI